VVEINLEHIRDKQCRINRLINVLALLLHVITTVYITKKIKIKTTKVSRIHETRVHVDERAASDYSRKVYSGTLIRTRART